MAINLEQIKIMLVDDNPSMRSLVKEVVKAFGVTKIAECSDGSDAFHALRDFPADMIISDWVMEPVDGLNLARMIRTAEDSPNPFVPIIMLTGHTERHRVEEARDAGVTEFLAKPISAAAVYKRMVQVINMPRPFVKTEGYTGPDRRRINSKLPHGVFDRRGKAGSVESISVGNAGSGLSQADVKRLMDC